MHLENITWNITTEMNKFTWRFAACSIVLWKIKSIKNATETTKALKDL